MGDQAHGTHERRGEGSCMSVSNDDDVEKVFPLQHLTHIISVPCNFEVYPVSVS